MRILATILLTLSTIYCFSQSAKRIALVIGNNEYISNPLTNPVNDAELIAKTLDTLGFEVSLKRNVNRHDLFDCIRSFIRQMDDPTIEVGFLYYAGHGLQYNDRNYLVPIDASISDVDQIIEYCVPTDIISDNRKQGQNTLITVLDACRSYPFGATRGTDSKGLTVAPTVTGSFTAYSTQAGSVAYDGNSNTNSPYSKALAKNLKIPNLTIEEIFKNVRSEVVEISGGKQNPREESGLTGGNLYLLRTDDDSTIDVDILVDVLQQKIDELLMDDTIESNDLDFLIDELKSFSTFHYMWTDDSRKIQDLELQIAVVYLSIRMFNQIRQKNNDFNSFIEEQQIETIESNLYYVMNEYNEDPGLIELNPDLYVQTIQLSILWNSLFDPNEYYLYSPDDLLNVLNSIDKIKPFNKSEYERMKTLFTSLQNAHKCIEEERYRNYKEALECLERSPSLVTNRFPLTIFQKEIIIRMMHNLKSYYYDTCFNDNDIKKQSLIKKDIVNTLVKFKEKRFELNLSSIELSELTSGSHDLLRSHINRPIEFQDRQFIEELFHFSYDLHLLGLKTASQQDSIYILSDLSVLHANYLSLCDSYMKLNAFESALDFIRMKLALIEPSELDYIFTTYVALYTLVTAKELNLSISDSSETFVSEMLEDLESNMIFILDNFKESDRQSFYDNHFTLLIELLDKICLNFPENTIQDLSYNLKRGYYITNNSIGWLSVKNSTNEIEYARQLITRDNSSYFEHLLIAYDISQVLASQSTGDKNIILDNSNMFCSISDLIADINTSEKITYKPSEQLTMISNDIIGYFKTHKEKIVPINQYIYYKSICNFFNSLSQDIQDINLDSIRNETFNDLVEFVSHIKIDQYDSLRIYSTIIETLSEIYKYKLSQTTNDTIYSNIISEMASIEILENNPIALTDFSKFFEGILIYHGHKEVYEEGQKHALEYIKKLQNRLNLVDVEPSDLFWIQRNICYFYQLAGSYPNPNSDKYLAEGLSYVEDVLENFYSDKIDTEISNSTLDFNEKVDFQIFRCDFHLIQKNYNAAISDLNESIGILGKLTNDEYSNEYMIEILNRMVIAQFAIGDTTLAMEAYKQVTNLQNAVPSVDFTEHIVHTRDLILNLEKTSFTYFTLSVPENCLPVIEIDANRNGTIEAAIDLRFYFDEQDSMHVERVKQLERYVGGAQYNEIGVNTSSSDSIKTVFYDNLPVSNIAAFGYKTGNNTYTVAVPSQSISNDNEGCNYLISYTYKNNYPYSWVVAKRYERTFYPLQANFNGFGSCYIHNFNE